MDYAIIRLGGKQYRVSGEGETLVVDRVRTDEGETFSPDVLLGSATVTAKVLAHERGPKIVIGKYKKRTGYSRHTGYPGRYLAPRDLTRRRRQARAGEEGRGRGGRGGAAAAESTSRACRAARS